MNYRTCLMGNRPHNLDLETLDRVSRDSGLATAVVDLNGRQVAVSNNNSICRNLNPGDEFSPACSRFCGEALERSLEAGQMIGFECHAGLDCRAEAFGPIESPLVAIVGRTFLKAENYRKATERAITGDWREFTPATFFENVLLTGSSTALTKTAEKVSQILSIQKDPEEIIGPEPSEPTAGPDPTRPVNDGESTIGESKRSIIPTPPKQSVKTADAQAWRSFFGSILQTDYARASAALLEFIAHQYSFSSLVWLERNGDRFDTSAAFGEMADRKVRLGISPDDQQLAAAHGKEMPLLLTERENERSVARTLTLFPIGIGREISAAVAVLDPIESEAIQHQVARICHSIAPQVEILRLRGEVSGRNRFAEAVKLFSDSLREIDADDFWEVLIQNTAELMNAERASLLIMDEKSETLQIKALIGAKGEPSDGADIGGRVAKIVFSKNEAVLVSDVARTNLPAASPKRRYRTPSFLSCPINVGSRTIGVINFTDHASGRPFSRRSLELFQAIAPQLAVAIDRAMLKERAGELEQLSVTDALTGLLNRRYIEQRLLEEIKRSTRYGFPTSFMMLDVDHFKSYNDEFGHPAGDSALKMVAHVIRETLRGADVAARFGGEEFSILLPQTTADEAETIAERIRHNIEQSDFPHRRVTTSIGVASCTAEICSTMDLVSAADKALYEAKNGGRNQVRTFRPATTGQIEENI